MAKESEPDIKMKGPELERFLADHFPESDIEIRVESVSAEALHLRLHFQKAFLRPGGTISGPTLMTLADTATYLLLLSRLGPVAQAVTSSLTIHFLRRPRPGDLIAEARPLKVGRRSAVVEVLLHGEENEQPVAQATVTYALPTRK